MESALETLQQSIELAQEYDVRDNKKVNLLRSHAQALEEDISFLLSFREPNKVFDKTVADTLKEARVLKRTIDREILEIQNAAPPMPPSHPTQPSTSTIEKVATAMLLPQIKLPTFNGEPSKFRLFYDTYVDAVQRNTSLSEMTKWVHLKNSLSGPALELINEIPETPGTLSVALQMLADTYGSEEKAVADLYTKLQSAPPAILTTASLRTTYAKIEGMLMSLEQYGHDVNANGYLRSVILGKFPPEVIFTIMGGRKLQLKEIRTQLNAYILSRESIADQVIHTTGYSAPTSTAARPRESTQRNKTPATKTPVQRTPRCIFCEAGHWSDQCTAVVSLTDRKNKLADRCHRCLRYAHPEKPCAVERRCCYCDSLEHNRALCPTKCETSKPTFVGYIQHPPGKEETSKIEQLGEYWTIMVEAKSDSGTITHKVRALIDPGSPSTVVSTALAAKLQLRTSPTAKAAFSGMNEHQLDIGYAADEQLILKTKDEQSIPLDVYVVNYIAGDLNTADPDEFLKKFPEHNNKYFPDTGAGKGIDILIGGDSLLYVLELGKGEQVNENYQLLSTRFGYIVVTARTTKKNDSPRRCFLTTTTEDIKFMYDLDMAGLRYVEKSEEKEEMEAIKKFYETIKYLEDRYEVAWPWRYYPPLLDTNYGLALGRLKSLYKQLRNKPEILLEYHKIITDQVQKQIAEPVCEKWPNDIPVHYLPHHPVINMEKSTKIRPVYDASKSGVAKGSSLNQNMLKGTKWLTDLVGVLLRFREHPVAVVADIERAFHQISIRQADRDVVRFLWLKNPLQEPTPDNIQIYRFTRVAFGIVSSPFLLNATIHFHAENHPNEFTPIIQRDLYADNLVTTLPEHVSFEAFYSETKKFFSSMGMNLTKWATNVNSQRNIIPSIDRQVDETQAVLGLRWNLPTDTLQLKKPNLRKISEKEFTKRKVLSQAAAVYDPLGWASPITLTAKIFIRKLWKNGFDWDQKLKVEYEEEWNAILTKLSNAEKISLSRMMFPNVPSTETAILEVHAFVDASAESYAVVIYAVKKTNTQIETSFVAAKNRLTPASKLTIPRLELLAVLTGCRFINFVLQALHWKSPRLFVWSDSKCVLAWLKTSRLLPPAIQRQVTEIKQFNVEEFKYVPTNLNRADVATRGAPYETLLEQKWWTAPQWIKNHENWPSQPQEEEPIIPNEPIVLLLRRQQRVLLEQKTQNNSKSPFNINIENYSTLSDLLRQTSCCIRALNALMKKPVLKMNTRFDFNLAKLLWVRWDQSRIYTEAAAKHTKESFTIRGIRAFLDENRVIRCLTRVQRAQIPETTVCPILLVRDSHLTKLIVLNKHTLNYHAGTAHTLAAVRKAYWIPQGRRQIYTVINTNCYQCRRQSAKTYPNPPPAPLPEFRVTRASKPFHSTAIDICGPFHVRVQQQAQQLKQKRWIILFTCTRIRAVHLEVLHDMTTKEILDAFRRFIARRGTPLLILTDNATQFHALNGIFQQLWPTVAKDTAVSTYFAKNGIQWKFLPPESPWMGGVHERIIQMVKTCLERTYGERTMLDRQFNTVTIEIEGVLNARPLTYVDQDPETKILSPNDFLSAQFNAVSLENVQPNTPDPILHLWKASEKYLDEFWQYWSKMYILELRQRDDKLRKKHHNANSCPEKGALVLIAEPEKKRSSWTMAVIERLIHSNDGQIRAAQLRLPNRTRIVRPIVKLAPLGLTMELPGVTDEQLNADRTAIELPLPEGVVDDVGNAGGSSSPQSTEVGAASEAGEPSNPWSQDSGEVEVHELELSDTDW